MERRNFEHIPSYSEGDYEEVLSEDVAQPSVTPNEDLEMEQITPEETWGPYWPD